MSQNWQSGCCLAYTPHTCGMNEWPNDEADVNRAYTPHTCGMNARDQTWQGFGTPTPHIPGDEYVTHKFTSPLLATPHIPVG